MHLPISRVLILSSLISFCVCLHVAFDLNGWQALPLDNKRVVDSVVVASSHLSGTIKQPVTAFKWIRDVKDWDLYRVSFISSWPQGNEYECHADVVWVQNPPNVTVFNTGCLAANPNLYWGL